VGVVLPPPPPHPDSPAVISTKPIAKQTAICRRHLRNGNSNRNPPDAMPRAGTRLLCVGPVAIVSVKLTGVPPEIARVAGLNEQPAFAGSPLQLRVMFPEYPADGPNDNAYVAGLPAVTGGLVGIGRCRVS
jgi:hypothetical protein